MERIDGHLWNLPKRIQRNQKCLFLQFFRTENGVADPTYFKYNGEWFQKICAKLEGRAVLNCFDGVR